LVGRRSRRCGVKGHDHGIMPCDSLSSKGLGRRSDTVCSNLILMRHWQSLWNKKNFFTGCVDVPLSELGVQEALEAGKKVALIPIDKIYVSALCRAQMTALIAMTQHRLQKVPIIQYTGEDDRAIEWSTVHSEPAKEDSIPVVRAWQLNERMYGELQGLDKKQTAQKYGDEQVAIWRRSYATPPPNGESLEMTAARSVKYFKEEIEPLLVRGENVMISAHGNSLRAIIMYLENLSPEEVVLLELATGKPLLWELNPEQPDGDKPGTYLRRGAPQESTQVGVYAVSPKLAAYRSVMETMQDPEYSS